ncbi:hypothetical protein PV10_04066 [Exophiala mesophila]|uniref:Uncharacterized protein n=1 Tax=Exophiala mesophila TaxID=212818 RepID=A0A0D1WU80_EXOME|nr:uncharacterized protein PV10_04066 [Exophiala mesophila]KIV92800.1 hypothetical protein PV10_04066 [Exophiala mesophila]
MPGLSDQLTYDDAGDSISTSTTEENPVNFDDLNLPPHFYGGATQSALASSERSQLPSSRLPSWFHERPGQSVNEHAIFHRRRADRTAANNIRRSQPELRGYDDDFILSLPTVPNNPDVEHDRDRDRDREQQADKSPDRTMAVSTASSPVALSSAPSSPSLFPARPLPSDEFPSSRDPRFWEVLRQSFSWRNDVGEIESGASMGTATETGLEREGHWLDDSSNDSGEVLRPDTYRPYNQAWEGVAEREDDNRDSEQNDFNARDYQNSDHESDRERDNVNAPLSNLCGQRNTHLDREERRVLEEFDLAIRSDQRSRIGGAYTGRRHREWSGR